MKAKLKNGAVRKIAPKRSKRNDLRELPSVRFRAHQVSVKFQMLCSQRILPTLKITGYKKEQKRKAVTQAAFALVRASANDQVVADTRNNSKTGVRLRIVAFDLLENAGFCKSCKGSEFSKKDTRYQATDRLMNLKDDWDQELLRPVPETEAGKSLGLVFFKPHKRNSPREMPMEKAIRKFASLDAHGRPDKLLVAKLLATTRAVERKLNQINEVNLGFAWKAKNKVGRFFGVNIELAQIHVRKIGRMPRLYTRDLLGGQNISKKVRERMLIADESIVELDFSGSLPRLAYHLRGIAVPANKDVYVPEKIIEDLWPYLETESQQIARDFIKKATIICFNNPSQGRAIGAIKNELRKHSGKNFRPLADFPSPKKLVHRIAKAHPRLANDLFVDKGASLMTVEAKIMYKIMKCFVLEMKKPALPIHDALIVRKSDASIAKTVMEQVYFDHTQFLPVIKKKNQ